MTAAETGVTRIQTKMRHAIDLSDYHGRSSIDAALEAAAQVGRFEQDDLSSILAHQGPHDPGGIPAPSERPASRLAPAAGTASGNDDSQS